MAQWVKANIDADSATMTDGFVDIEAFPFISIVTVTPGLWEIEVNNLAGVVFRLWGTWTSKADASAALEDLLHGYTIEP